jgi:uncharacterized protein with FMN-binding domain
MCRVSDHGGSHKKVSNSLVALSSAAVLAVYTAGYLRTKPAADRFALQAEARRPTIPAPLTAKPVSPPARPDPVTIATAPPTAPSTPLADKSSRTVPRSTGSAPRLTEKTRKPAPVAPPKAAETAPAVPTSPVPTLPAAVVEEPKPAPVPVAPVPAAPPPAAPEPPKPQYKDGKYLGWGTSRHGDIQAEVVIEGGRIASATIAQCLTRYDCSVIAKLPPQVAQRQSPETDYVSGATQSTNAFYYAVVEALSKAK